MSHIYNAGAIEERYSGAEHADMSVKRVYVMRARPRPSGAAPEGNDVFVCAAMMSDDEALQTCLPTRRRPAGRARDDRT